MGLNVVLISTYELGRQPFGVASPAAWLKRAGAAVTCVDLSREELPQEPVRQADLIAFYVPMHTATRMAALATTSVRLLNPRAHLCFYGLYAPVNEAYLREIGGGTILGGEFEEGLVSLVKRLQQQQEGGGGMTGQTEPVVSLGRQQFLAPDRTGLPPLAAYAHLDVGDSRARVAGYTEASRGCKHLCRHCPIVPVYNGVFRVVQPEVVLEDIRRQVAAGAEHMTFGDPDFLNGPRHAVDIVERLHREFPQLTYDVTIKIEHLRKHRDLLPLFKQSGCLFVTTAVESVDDAVLDRLAKGHTRADFLAVVEDFRQAGLALAPTFVPFTPWTTLEGYCDLLSVLARLDLADHVGPVQFAIRLLIPAGSHLLELEDVRRLTEGRFDQAGLSYRWDHPDPRVDELAARVQRLVWRLERKGKPRRAIFAAIWEEAHRAAGLAAQPPVDPFSRTSVPFLNEPWYC